MTHIWIQRPPSFPNDDDIAYSAAEFNQFNDTEDLTVEENSQNKSIELKDSPRVKTKLSLRARDSIYIRREKPQRNSAPYIFDTNNNSEDDSDSEANNDQSTRGVRFSIAKPKDSGIDNQAFEDDEVELRNKNKNYINQNFNNQNWNELDGFLSTDISAQKRGSEEQKAWDRFATLPPPDEDETLDGKWIEVFIKWFKIFAYLFTFCVTLGCAVISKSIILLMTSMIRVNRTIPICNDHIYNIESAIDRDKRYVAIYGADDPERIAWLWCLFFAVITPDLFAFGRSLRICYFKTYKVPTMNAFLTVFTAETLYTIGISLLVFLILPTIDAIKGAMMTNALSLVPGLLLLISNHDKTNQMNRTLTIMATSCQLISFVVWPLDTYHEDNTKFWYILPLALFLISFSWWENFINPSSKNPLVQSLLDAKKDLEKSRYFTYIMVSIWKLVLIFCLMILIEYLNDGTEAVKSTFTKFAAGFQDHGITIVRDKRNIEFAQTIEGETHHMIIDDPLLPVWILLIQICATYMCYAVGKFSCKVCIDAISFAIPVNLAVPVTVSFLWAMISASTQDKCEVSQIFKGFQYIFWYTSETNTFTYEGNTYNYVSTFMWIISLASQIWIAIHIWFSTSERLASTEKLFIIPMYSSVIIDQSLAMNRRRLNSSEPLIKEGEEEVGNKVENTNNEVEDMYTTQDMDGGMDMYEDVNEPMAVKPSVEESDDTVRIFVCATMWHEDKNEMIQMLKSVMRLDADQCARRQAQSFFSLTPSLTDYYEIEIHIFFDDAFDQGPSNDEDDRLVNRFVKQLIETMDEAASNVHEINITLRRPNLVPTPYGGKLEWTLPGQNKLVAHLKDKILIRHRKRWSQCMYMYYLLGHRIAQRDIDESRKETIANNTFILALDGDINFRPHAVHLVLDLMKKNKKLGAACGRIHPIGSGPMVWYQKFEYAIGHWLQKATEHVFGCVLCSPGCFSLFRVRALMDDSVMNKYTTKPSEAIHYVQYDQGEDRWLCTLLLQKGWRIEYCAASDSYTHAPEDFGEFYTQRRRWAPSTMANILDLLSEYKRTIECNNDISKPYIIYQAMLMVGTVLSPGTIFLMVVGAMNTVMGLTSTVSLLCNIVPILSFSIICLVVKKNDHIIFVATILSTAYALLMLAVLVGTGIEIADKGVLTPNSIFFIGMISSFFVAAIIHPQEFACVIPILLYLLLIPSMYLLLTIYSITNMHIVTWGTREVKSKLTAKEAAMEAQKAAEAEEAKRKKQKNPLGFLDFSQYGSKAGLFTCMCCSNSKAEEDSAKLSEIRAQISQVSESMSSLKTSIESLEPQRQRRTSGGSIRRVERIEGLPTIPGGDTDDDEENLSDIENSSLEEDRPKSPSVTGSLTATEPRWIRNDKYFKKFSVLQLAPLELEFWNEFIPKYLLPLDEDPKEQARIAGDLKQLRNRAVFAFGIMNTIFILFVFLLQMHKDVFGILIPAGTSGYNRTYIEDEDRWDVQPIYKYVNMDPIGLCLVIFFGTILIVQIIGMFMHRFGTLAHLLAFTTIDFCYKKLDSDITNVHKNAVNIVKQFQKLKGIEELDETNNKPGDRRQSMFPKPPQHLDLGNAFRKRIMSLKPDSSESYTNLQGNRRKSIAQALVQRRNTIIENRRKSMAPFVSFNLDEHHHEESPSIGRRSKSTTPERSPANSIRTTSSTHSSRSTPENRVVVTPPLRRLESGEDRPATGQHNIAHYNLVQQSAPNNLDGMSEGLSADIIRNSLNTFKNWNPENNETNGAVSPDHTSSVSSNLHRVEAQVHSTDNSGSSTASTVSSNIDFNFEPFDDDLSNNDNDFPVTTFQPTRVSQRDSQEIPWNIPIAIGETQQSPKTGRLSTRF